MSGIVRELIEQGCVWVYARCKVNLPMIRGLFISKHWKNTWLAVEYLEGKNILSKNSVDKFNTVLKFPQNTAFQHHRNYNTSSRLKTR